MNQQAFYRDTAIGEWLEDGSYRSWGERRHTLQVKQHRLNQSMSGMLQNIPSADRYYGNNLQNCWVPGFDWNKPNSPWRLEGLEAFFDDSIIPGYKPPGMTYEERFGRGS